MQGRRSRISSGPTSLEAPPQFVMDLRRLEAAPQDTLIETAKLNDVDPQAWLADVLERIPDYKINRADELLPWNCASVADPTANT